MTAQLYISPTPLQRWLTYARAQEQPSYISRLAEFLCPSEIKTITEEIWQKLDLKTVAWQTTVAFYRCQVDAATTES